MFDKFDKRIINRSIKKGLISDKELNNHFKNLPDLKNSCTIEDFSTIIQKSRKKNPKSEKSKTPREK